MKSITRFVLLAVISMVAGVVSYAQVTTASIAGRVADKDGAVAGAPVIAIYQPTGSTYYAVTDANGNYRINGVTPGGPYAVSIEMLGYRKVENLGVYAPLGETVVVNSTLEDEALNLDAAVFVADASESGMNIRRSGAGTNISRATMENIPTVSRSMNDIMALTPQASTTSGFAVGGGNYRGSSVTVDGAAFNNAFGIGSNLPAGGSPISLDALDQISINITPFDVRQSGFQGGAINAVTKSGTNEFKASVYDYYTSDKFRGYSVAGNEVTHTSSLNHTIGATVGGPIIKNKLFFFLNGEYSFDTLPGTTSVARTSASQAFGRDVKENRPTVDQMESMKQFVGDKFGYNPGRYQGYDLETPDYKFLGRLDWNINDSNKLTFRFSHTHTYGSNPPSTSMSPVGGNDSKFVTPDGGAIAFNRNNAGRQSQYALYYEAARYFQEQNFTSFATELNSRIFGGNNVLRVTYSHQNEPRSYVGDLFPTVDILSNAEITTNDTHAILTTIGIDPFTYGNLRDVSTWTATDEFSYTTGIHNLIGGLQYEWNRAKNGFMQGGAGWFIYDTWDRFVADVTNPSDATLPSGFMITHANLDDPTSQTFPSFDYAQWSAYLQDEITFSEYFKLTAGLRLEMPIISNPNDNLNKDFARVASENPNSSLAGLSTADLPKTRVSFSPRIGFNWDILKDRSLILRGGSGIYTGRIPNVWLVSAMGNANVLQYQYIANPSTGNPMIHFADNRADIIKNVWASQGGFKKADLAAPTGTTIIAKDLKMPSSWKTSLALDAKLPGGVKATFEGIYSYNFNEVYARSLGYAKTGTVQLPGEPEARSLWTDENLRNMSGSKIHGYYVHNSDAGHGTYYSLTAQLSKTFNWGLDLMAAYTRSGSRTLSDGAGDQISEFGNIQTVNGVNEPMLGYAYYVTPNRLIANAAYTIKEGPHFATKLSVFYEGNNTASSNARISYLMKNVSGAGNASQLVYIPTESELKNMPFTSEQNRNDFETFIAGDKYLKNHRGEYSERNGVIAPFLHRFNVRVAQEFYFNLAGRQNTLEFGVDIKNVGNLINDSWGVYKSLSSNVILAYANGAYTFTKPEWNTVNGLGSTWQMLFSARWSF